MRQGWSLPIPIVISRDQACKGDCCNRAIAALVHVLVPYMVLSIATVLQSVDRRLEESAKILGAGRLRASPGRAHPH